MTDETPRCGKHTLSGDIACRLPADQPHTVHAGGFPQVEWIDTLEDDGKQPRPELSPHVTVSRDLLESLEAAAGNRAALVAERDELQGRLDDALEDRDDWRARAGVLEDDRDGLEAKLEHALTDLRRSRELTDAAQEAAGRFADHADKAQARVAELVARLEPVRYVASKSTPDDGARDCGLLWSVGATRSVITRCHLIGPHDVHADAMGHHISDATARRLGLVAP